jgi:hypothetical protein
VLRTPPQFFRDLVSFSRFWNYEERRAQSSALGSARPRRGPVFAANLG